MAHMCIMHSTRQEDSLLCRVSLELDRRMECQSNQMVLVFDTAVVRQLSCSTAHPIGLVAPSEASMFRHRTRCLPIWAGNQPGKDVPHAMGGLITAAVTSSTPPIPPDPVQATPNPRFEIHSSTDRIATDIVGHVRSEHLRYAEP